MKTKLSALLGAAAGLILGEMMHASARRGVVRDLLPNEPCSVRGWNMRMSPGSMSQCRRSYWSGLALMSGMSSAFSSISAAT